jgi:hypothetical protein
VKRKDKDMLTIVQKIDIIKKIETDGNHNVLKCEHNIGSLPAHDIKAQKDELPYFVASSESSSKGTSEH